jgi:ABC-type phosphate transport system ATPase subunit
MAPFVFDTLSASKQLREAGMAEGVAEAVVSVFQHAATMPDISHLATKADVADMATRTYITNMATRDDIAQVRLAIADLRAEVTDKLRQQGWMLLGGVGVMLAISTYASRAFS